MACRGVGEGSGLVEADAGYIGVLDGCGMVELVFGEGDGEVLDAVSCAEFFEEQDELTQFFNEPVLIISRGDGDQHHHVVGEVIEAVRVREDDERWCEYRVFREEACAVGVVLIAELRSRSAVVFGEILFDVGEGCSESRVAYDRKVGGRLRMGNCGRCRHSLAAEDGFHTGEELVEVVGCFAVSLDGFATAHRAMPDMRFKLTRECFAFHRLDLLLVFWELSSFIFSSRRCCFWLRARAVSCTRWSTIVNIIHHLAGVVFNR